MIYMLDSNTCAFIMNERHGVIERFRKALPLGVGVSSIVLSELEYGVRKSSAQERNRNKLNSLCALISIYPYETAATAEYGIIRSELERQGQVIGSLDMLIAAHAKSLGLIFVTNNTGEFSRVAGLALEDWVEKD
ncbi:MAG: PIN domain-containing protein [Firmicutes bacterium]|nr:PIN domain-containing protein [Bacillota bacterium]